MFEQLFLQTEEYKKLAGALSGKGACALFGLPAAGRALVYAALARALGRTLCIVTPGEAEATRFAADLNTLGVAAAVFPARDYLLRPIESAGREYEYRRLAVLGDLAGGRLQAVCVPSEGLTQYTVPPEDFRANTRTLRPGDAIEREDLIALLLGAGYVRRDRVDGPGQFSIRGEILDLYAPDMKAPVRVEFWGDEIDTMHTFDLATQRRDDAVEKIYVSPAREVLFGAPEAAAEALRAFLKKQRGKRRTAMQDVMAPDLDLLDAGALPPSMDKYLGVRYPVRATLLDHLEDPLLFLEEPASIREAGPRDRLPPRRGAGRPDGGRRAVRRAGRPVRRARLAVGADRALPHAAGRKLRPQPARPAAQGPCQRALPQPARLGRRGVRPAGRFAAAVRQRHGGHGAGRHAARGPRALRATCAPGGWLSPPTRPPRRSRGLCRCCPAAFRPGAGCRLRAMR